MQNDSNHVYWLQPPYNDKEQHDRINDIPFHLRTVCEKLESPLFRKVILYYYLKLHPQKFAEEETGVCIQNTDRRFDLENAHSSVFLVTSRFKVFCEQLAVPVDFFPVTSDGELRYLMMWRRTPVLGEYEVDVDHSQYEKIITYGDGISFLKFPMPARTVFSSSYLNILSIDTLFTFANQNTLYCTQKMQRAIKEAGFNAHWTKFEAVETPVDLTESTRKQQVLWLTEARREQYRRSFDHLEQILLEEGDKDVIEKFNEEIKSKWEDQFIRFKKDTLPPDERVKMW